VKQLYEIEIKTTIVVAGESEVDAMANARRDMASIKQDQYFDVEMVRPLGGEVLPTGWDGMCIPYGDTDGKTIREMDSHPTNSTTALYGEG
jgi:hypothetical protein